MTRRPQAGHVRTPAISAPPARGQISPRPGLRPLQVSRTTARFIADGHPWVRPDRFTRGLENLRAGDQVTLVDEAGRRLASALADPAEEICARVYHRRPDMPFHPAQALGRAWERRASLAQDAGTTCYRVVHGEGDHLPAVRIERYDQVVVVTVLSGCIEPYAEELCRALGDRLPEAIIVRRDHQDDRRREAVTSRRLDGRPLDPDAVVIGSELGVRYPLRPFAGLSTGLYVDQRSTRAWLCQQAAGKRVLNLFSYTGAFSLALLRAGAAQAIDVDLSAPALARAQEGAALNGVADRLLCRHGDCRAIVAGMNDVFDIIVCDPPTAAQGGGGWILRRDYPEILRVALRRLAPGGLLVACCNTVGGKPFDLSGALRDQAGLEGIAITRVDGPSLGDDIPQIDGFPEGRPFRLVAVRRS
jgi:23S rRNA (cytosine1962-C5)-methyltransferase